jgi:hypothetical protein
MHNRLIAGRFLKAAFAKSAALSARTFQRRKHMGLIGLRARGFAVGLLALATVVAGGSAVADAPAGSKQAELAAVLLEKTYTRQVIEAWRRILLNPSALPNCDCGSVAQAKINAAWQAAVNGAFNAEEANDRRFIHRN